jgi:hypothetical protein
VQGAQVSQRQLLSICITPCGRISVVYPRQLDAESFHAASSRCGQPCALGTAAMQPGIKNLSLSFPALGLMDYCTCFGDTVADQAKHSLEHKGKGRPAAQPNALDVDPALRVT